MKLAIVSILLVVALMWLMLVITVKAHEPARWAETQMQEALDACESTLPRNQQCRPVFAAQPVITDYLI